MSKKQDEQKILALIYPESEYAEILSSESPDFCIRHDHLETFFGVEITEFYLSETNARLSNIPNYVQEITDGYRLRHREDSQLEVIEITLTSPNGKKKGNHRVIFQEKPPLKRYTDQIVQIIKNKDKKIENYLIGLEHTNLIILDKEYTFASDSVNDFFRLFFTPALKKMLYLTNFREIYFVTIFDQTRRVYIPLKMALLLSNFFYFGKLVNKLPWEISENAPPLFPEQTDSMDKILLLFARYMKTKTDNVHVVEKPGNVEVLFGNIGLAIKNKQISIHDYNDHPLPANKCQVREDMFTTFFAREDCLRKEKEILEEFIFFSELPFDVKGEHIF